MAFVNEKGKKVSESRTVDYERGLILTSVGQDRENNYTFNLVIGDFCVVFSAHYEMSPVGQGL